MGVKQLTGNVVAGAPGIRHQGSRSYLNGFVGRNGKARIVPAVGDDLSVFHDWKRLANFEDSVAGALQCGEGLAVGIERQAIEIENLLHGTFDQADVRSGHQLVSHAEQSMHRLHARRVLAQYAGRAAPLVNGRQRADEARNREGIHHATATDTDSNCVMILPCLAPRRLHDGVTHQSDCRTSDSRLSFTTG